MGEDRFGVGAVGHTGTVHDEPLSHDALATWAAFRCLGARERASLTRLRAARFGRTVDEIIDLREESQVHAPVLLPLVELPV